jgi:hypothetical protein
VLGFLGGGRREIVTLAIEDSDLRFLSVRGRVLKWGSVPLPKGLVTGGVINDPLEMGRIVDETFRENGLDRRRVISSVVGLRAIPRMLTMPKLQASMLEAAISREAKKEMPVSLENLYLSWQSLPPEGDQQRIYLLGVPREMIDVQVRMLDAAGIQPLAMDLKPLALVRAVGQEQAVIINLEEGMLDIILVVEGLPAIMRTFGLDQREGSMEERIERLLTELNQTMRFYNDSHRNATIRPNTPVYASGRVLGQPEVLAYLRYASDRPIEQPPAPMPCPADLPVPDYLTNLGLALKQIA